MLSDHSISGKQSVTQAPEDIHRKRMRLRRNILLVFSALVLITTLEVYFLQKQSPFATISNSIAVLGLFNLMLILLFLLI